jgi:hypothetical protein
MGKSTQIPLPERVTPFAEIQKMTQTQTVEQFVAQMRHAARAFALAAKLILHLAATVKPPQTIGGLLRKSGIRKTTIDNARQAARVFEELVLPKHISETQFDQLSFAECVTVNRAMSGAAKEKQSAKSVVAMMKSHPQTWDEELDCLARHGRSVAAQAKIEKQAEEEAKEKAAAQARAESASPVSPSGKSAASETTVAPRNVVNSGITKRTAEDAIKLIHVLDETFNELTPTEAAKALPALTELHANVVAFVGTIEPSSKVVKLPQRTTGRKAKTPAKKAA